MPNWMPSSRDEKRQRVSLLGRVVFAERELRANKRRGAGPPIIDLEFTLFERLADDRVLQRLFLQGKNARLQDALEILQTVAEPIVLDRPVVLIANRNAFVRDVLLPPLLLSSQVS